MKKIAKKLILSHRRLQFRRVHRDYYRKIIAQNPEYAQPADGETEWMERWSRYDSCLSPLCYRIYSRFCGCDINIVPLETCTNLIEPIFQPSIYSQTYDDKNLLGRILPLDVQATTYLRSIQWHLYNNEYQPVDNIESVLKSIEGDVMVKPTHLNSGKGIRLFQHNGRQLVDQYGTVLDEQWLRQNYGGDFQVQQRIVQHPTLAHLNPICVNTIRLATYRDANGHIHCLGGTLRIGAQGQYVDNSHHFGSCIGIADDGTLRNYCFDIYLSRSTMLNGINLATEAIRIDNYEQVKLFAIDMAARFLHHDLLAFDLSISPDGKPLCVEVNTQGFSAGIIQSGGRALFGKLTDEVLHRVEQHRGEITLQMVQTL